MVLSFDATYGVEVSAWEEHLAPPPPPRTFALALTLDTTWNPALADAESDERVAFESGFKTSVATELGIDSAHPPILLSTFGSLLTAWLLCSQRRV